MYEEAQRQANIENITRLALPDVSKDAKPKDVENDWITNFFDQCRLISDEEMQRLWAKVLAGEANNPGKYSKRTVGLLSSLDKSDAELFRKLCSFGWFIGNVVPLVYDLDADIYTKAGLNLVGLGHLNDIGLVRFESFTTFAAGRLPQKTVVSYYTTRVAVEFPKPKDNELDLGHVMLSKAGQELAPLCETERHRDFLDYVVERWRKENLKVDVLRAEQGAAPNSDPAPPVGDLGVTERPASTEQSDQARWG